MASEKIILVFALGVLVLVAAFLVPVMRDSTDSDAKAGVSLYVGEEEPLTDVLTVGLRETNASGNQTNATVELRNERTLERNITTINDSATMNVSNESIAVHVDRIENDSARVVAEYPPTFGWGTGPAKFLENTGIIVVLAGVLMLFGVVIKITGDAL